MEYNLIRLHSRGITGDYVFMRSWQSNARPVWIGIQGGTCAGKTTLALAIRAILGEESTLLIGLDRFFHPFDLSNSVNEPCAHNFDNPDALDWVLADNAVLRLDSNKTSPVPRFNYVSGLREGVEELHPSKHIIIEGLWPFHSTFLRELLDIKVFIDTPPDIRLARRLTRDVIHGERGWTLGSALSYYVNCSRPMHLEFVEIWKGFADVVIDGQTDAEASARKVVELLKT